MIVYKYKSLGDSTCPLEQEKQIGYLKDICMNNHIYAADFYVLDDPMEGVFNSYRDNRDTYISDIIHGKIDTHICSLSPTYQSMLMWSFYANQHKGCCIEVEIPDDKIKKVDYVKYPMDVDASTLEYEEKIEKILLRKYKDWAFEKEIRVLTRERYVKANVKKVFIGMRASEEIYDKLNTEILCLRNEIKVERMKESMFEHIDTSENNNK